MAREWTPERLAKFQATMAAKKRGKKSTKRRKTSTAGQGAKARLAFRPKNGGRMIEVKPTDTGSYEIIERVILATAPDMTVAESIGKMLREG